MYVVDTATVDPVRLEQYLALLESQVVPLMEAAGARLDSCRAGRPDLGRPVDVQVTWTCAGYAAWNEIRRTLVLDPAYYACAGELAGLRLGGARRFLDPAPFDPAAAEPARA